MVKENVKEIVETDERTPQSVDDIPRITATITITRAEIKTVQNFLWKLTEKGMLDQLRFDDSAAMIQSKGTIRVNEFDAHLEITKQLFKLLLADPDEKTEKLGRYALPALPSHLDFLRQS